IGRQRVEAGQREAVAHALDLILQPPPFLDHHHARRIAAGGIGEIAAGVLAVRTLEGNAGTHGFLPRFPGADWRPFWLLRRRDAIGSRRVMSSHRTHNRHPEVRALARLEGWAASPLLILRGSPKGGSHLRMTAT